MIQTPFPANRRIDEILCDELALRFSKFAPKLYVDYDGSIRIYRRGLFFAEIAHLLIRSDTKVDAFYRYYVPKKTKNWIGSIIRHTLETCSLTKLRASLSDHLPQEWVVGIVNQTTCQGRLRLVLIETPPPGKPKFTCLIRTEPARITVFAPTVSSPYANTVIDRLKKITQSVKQFQKCCITLTECPLCCETCPKAFPFYE
ncbi:MAG TPA: hypothetical protein PLI45_04755 [Candidatus Woesebacteria bacterium]|nr:hypothetical protein [Candidatus Woesebacteria bacterium]